MPTDMVTLPDFFLTSSSFSAPVYILTAGSLTPYAPVYLKTVSDGASIVAVFNFSGE